MGFLPILTLPIYNSGGGGKEKKKRGGSCMTLNETLHLFCSEFATVT